MKASPAGDAFTRTRLMPTFGDSAERPAEGPKVGVLVVFRVFRVFWLFRVFRLFRVFMVFRVFNVGFWGWLYGLILGLARQRRSEM